VLRPKGVAFVRTTIRERLDALVYQYWPQLHAIEVHRFPSTEELVANFVSAGFALGSIGSLAQPVHRGPP
jgi:hypothetical protein